MALGIAARTVYQTRVNFKVFYFFSRFGDEVKSTLPVEMGQVEICALLLGRLREEDDYLGIVDDHENLLQILYEPASGRYWIEIPLLDQRASYGQYVSAEELTEFILRLPRRFRRPQFPGFEFREW